MKSPIGSTSGTARLTEKRRLLVLNHVKLIGDFIDETRRVATALGDVVGNFQLDDVRLDEPFCLAKGKLN